MPGLNIGPDRQVRRAFDDPNAELAQRGTELGRALHVDRFNAHTAIREILLRESRWQAEARPIAVDGARRRCRDDVATLDQPLQRFLNLLGWKIPLQSGNEFLKALSAFSYCRGEGAIKLAVQKEFPVLRVQADDVGR